MSGFDDLCDHLREVTGAGRALGGLLARIGPDGDERAFATGRPAPDGPPLTDPTFPEALADATERLTAQSIADTFLASAVALGVGLVLCVALLRRRDERRTRHDAPRGDHDERERHRQGDRRPHRGRQ